MRNTSLTLLLTLTLAGTALHAQDATPTATPATPAASPAPSPTPADEQVTADILRAIRGEDSLSASAKAIKVATTSATVTLHGVVTSIAEKSTVDSLARKAAGNRRVDSQLTLALDK